MPIAERATGLPYTPPQSARGRKFVDQYLGENRDIE
jgi:hypothetical protein